MSVAFPFAKGQLLGPEKLQILDGDKALFAQKHVTARWDDGSVKWLLVHFQVDLPGNAAKTITTILGGKESRGAATYPASSSERDT